ncbi:hypothetical protein [Pseudoflavitalea rhizosphaerae]|uniref:hypothetical protein n=1 Tax=Pseudoflavitalea rhizosphaerae TaxID=1884793 RepID=UPI000F8EA667|nr:hypothetical protein [Pseudoflavitalea rhizosphaerae]
MIYFSTPKYHWNYFLAIQKDLEKISRYIEFCPDNLQTYSIELAHILLSASSEVDVLMKQLCNTVAPGGIFENINHYRNAITIHIPDLINEQISIPRYGMTHRPWENWNGLDNPDWWRSYNRVKHQRNDHYSEANLQNTINSVGALLITSVYYYKYAFSAEAGHNIDFRDATRQLDSSHAFLMLDHSYYYQHLLV